MMVLIICMIAGFILYGKIGESRIKIPETSAVSQISEENSNINPELIEN